MPKIVKVAVDQARVMTPSLTGRQGALTKKLIAAAAARAKRVKDAPRPRLASAPEILIPAAISTGSKILDLAIRRVPPYGVPVRRVTEIWSKDEAEGKTTLVSHLLRSAQAAGMLTQLQDTENAYDMDLARQMGVDTDLLMYDNPDAVEVIFDELDNRVEDLAKALNKGEAPPPLLYAWDTLSSTPTFVELRGKAGQVGYGTQVAKMMSYCLKRGCGRVRKHDVAFVVVNQGRVNPTVIRGDPTCTAGGKALRFYASVRLLVKKLQPVCDHRGRQIGYRQRVVVKKNKVSPPDGVAEFDVIPDKGGIQDLASWFWFFHKIGRLDGGASGRWQLKLPDGGGVLKFTEKSFQQAMEDADKVEAVARYMEALAAAKEVPMLFHGKLRALGKEEAEAADDAGPEESSADEDALGSIFDEESSDEGAEDDQVLDPEESPE